MQKALGRGSIQKIPVSLELHPGADKMLLGDWAGSRWCRALRTEGLKESRSSHCVGTSFGSEENRFEFGVPA